MKENKLTYVDRHAFGLDERGSVTYDMNKARHHLWVMWHTQQHIDWARERGDRVYVLKGAWHLVTDSGVQYTYRAATVSQETYDWITKESGIE